MEYPKRVKESAERLRETLERRGDYQILEGDAVALLQALDLDFQQKLTQ